MRQYLQPERLAHVQAAVAVHGGVGLTTTYRGLAAKYHFRCRTGHEWEALGNNVLAGKWCRRCYFEAHQRRAFEKMRGIAIARGGRCLFEAYRSTKHHLEWRCERGHIWRTIPGNVVREHWCPNCKFLALTKDPVRRLKFE